MPETSMDILRRRRPDVVAAFDALAAAQAKDPAGSLEAIVRNIMAAYRAGADRAVFCKNTDIQRISETGVKAQYIVPAGCTRGRHRILYLHGGAWCAGQADDYQAIGAVLARECDAPVLMLEYRLAPEHPFPQGLEDCLAGYDWLLHNGPSGPDPVQQAIIAGDSAGGNLAMAVTISRIQKSLPPPLRLAILSGLVGFEPRTSEARNDPFASADALAAMVATYTGGGTTVADPLLNPFVVPDAILAQFPPVMLQASTDEYLMNASILFAQRLIGLGVRTLLSAWPDMPHVWHAFLDTLPESRAAIAEVADFLR